MSNLAPGLLLAGERYKVVERVGDGAQGAVYRVWDTRLERDAAMKLSVAGDADVDAVRARFERELRTASRFAHPRILQVFDAGALDTGAPWVVMEWMGAGSLQHLLARLAAANRRLPLRFVKHYGLCIAEALDAVHAAGLVHRDVKLANVLVSDTGEVKLGDFGIAEQPGDGSLEVAGTPGFMAPEHRAGRWEPASDLFGLGVCVFAMLTGALPEQVEKDGRPSGVVVRGQYGSVPEELRPFLRGCLASDPRERFADARTAARALLAVDARGDIRPRLAKAEQLPTEPPGGLRAAAEEGEGDLRFELVDDTQAHSVVAPEPGRTLSAGAPRTVHSTVLGSDASAEWLQPATRSRLGVAVALVLGIVGLFAAAWIFRPTDGASLRDHLVACQAAVTSGGAWSLPEDVSLSVKSDDARLLNACAAWAAGDLHAAWLEANGVLDEPFLSPRRDLVLATVARLGGARDHAAAAALYASAADCADDDCGAVRAAAQRGLAECCLVVAYSPAECRALDQERASRIQVLERSRVLLGDGLAHRALGDLQSGLVLPVPKTGACEELPILELWLRREDLPAPLRAQVEEARDALASCPVTGVER